MKSQDTRRISTPTICLNETENVHQFRSLRVEKRNKVIRSTSIILETSESVPETRSHADLPQRPNSCGSSRQYTSNKTLSRNSSKYNSNKSITKNDEKLNSNNVLTDGDLKNNHINNTNINRTNSSATSNIIVHEQYWSCCFKKWTRRERILITTVLSLIFIVLGLVIVIGIISRSENNDFFM